MLFVLFVEGIHLHIYCILSLCCMWYLSLDLCLALYVDLEGICSVGILLQETLLINKITCNS